MALHAHRLGQMRRCRPRSHPRNEDVNQHPLACCLTPPPKQFRDRVIGCRIRSPWKRIRESRIQSNVGYVGEVGDGSLETRSPHPTSMAWVAVAESSGCETGVHTMSNDQNAGGLQETLKWGFIAVGILLALILFVLLKQEEEPAVAPNRDKSPTNSWTPALERHCRDLKLRHDLLDERLRTQGFGAESRLGGAS